MRNLRTFLSTLLHPFRHHGKFIVRFNVPAHPLLSGPLNGFTLENAHYSIKARLEHDGVVSYQLDGLDQESFLWRRDGGARTGPVGVQIFAWDLEKRKDLREPLSFEMRKLIREWNGMLIFRDGFRVWPYGKNGHDWMGLDRRRVDNPTERIGNNQLIGLINLSGRHNPGLRDLSNREGLRESASLVDLRAFITEAVLPHLEAYRRKIRRRRQFSFIKERLEPKHLNRYRKAMGSSRRVRLELDRVESRLNDLRDEVRSLGAFRDALNSRLDELTAIRAK